MGKTTMTKKVESKELSVPTGNMLPTLYAESEAGSRVVSIPDGLPSIFKGAEVMSGSFLPMVQWSAPGQWVWGFYRGKKESVGPNESPVYEFSTPLKNGEEFSWATWGNYALNEICKRLQFGDVVCLYFQDWVDVGRGEGKEMKGITAMVRRKSELSDEIIQGLIKDLK